MAHEWVTAAEAVRLLKPVFGNSAYMAQKTICKRAHNGLIRARAERLTANENGRGFPIAVAAGPIEPPQSVMTSLSTGAGPGMDGWVEPSD
jgi:hypothetical protein